jgi:hypothetical protein
MYREDNDAAKKRRLLRTLMREVAASEKLIKIYDRIAYLNRRLRRKGVNLEDMTDISKSADILHVLHQEIHRSTIFKKKK